MKIEFDHADLKPLIESVVAETIAKIQATGERLSYSEAEAAELLGMARHQLRDRRLQGDIKGKKVGGRWYYSTETLRQFITS